MDIETQITPGLWNAIEQSYNSENYAHAIRDAMAFVTEVLRDKTGLTEDGKDLVGKALGFTKGREPLLKVNSLQTETEQNIQIGLRETLSGMYALIRNPRSHERVTDSKKQADTIILFIDYLLAFLGEVQQSFTPEGFVEFVRDPFFVAEKDYAEELVRTIPIRKRFDTLIALYREKDKTFSSHLRITIAAILDQLSDTQRHDFAKVVSDELQRVAGESDAALIVEICPSYLWPMMERRTRLRVENIFIQKLRLAYYVPERPHTSNSPPTGIKALLDDFLLKEKLQEVILGKLSAKNFDHSNFVAKYLFTQLPQIFETEETETKCIRTIADCLRGGNEFVKDKLLEVIGELPATWRNSFMFELDDLTDRQNPEIYLPQDVPFLGKFRSQSNPARPPAPAPLDEEDVPF